MSIPTLEQALCLALLERVTAQAAQDGLAPVSVALVDANGELMTFTRMDQAPARTIKIAQAKAYTAVRMQCSTLAFNERLHHEKLAVGYFMDHDFCPLPGGIPVYIAGQCVGAIGISGRSLADDHTLALFAEHAFNVL